MHVRSSVGAWFDALASSRRWVFGDDPEDPGAPAPAADPSYELPADVPRDDDAPPPGGAPPQPPAPPSTPAGAAEGGTPPADESIPRHRFDETLAERDRLAQLVATQTQQINLLLERLTTGPAPAEPERPQPSPQDLEIRQRLLAVFPELGMLDQLRDVVAQREQLLAAAEAVPTWRQREEQYYDQYAERSIASVFDEAAEHTLGKGKAGKDLDPLVQESIKQTFIRWVTMDPQRAARYEREDPSIPKQFWAAYKAAHYDAMRRDQQAQLLARADHPPKVPQGGPGAPPPPTAPSALDLNDEDAVHKAAWAARDSVGV